MQLATSLFFVYDHVDAAAGSTCPFRCYKISEKWAKVISLEGDNLKIDEDFFLTNKLSIEKYPLYHEIEIRVSTNPLTRLFLLQNEDKIRPDQNKPVTYKPHENLQEFANGLNESLYMIEKLATIVNNPMRLKKGGADAVYYCETEKVLNYSKKVKNRFLIFRLKMMRISI